MSIKYYAVLPKEREQLKKDALKRAMTSIKGPIGFYEAWSGEEPSLTMTHEALQARQPFCKLAWQEESLRECCQQDYKHRAATCTEPQVSLCAVGVYNIICPVTDEQGHSVTLIGGEFRIRERKVEAEKQLEQFLEKLPPPQRSEFRKTWLQIPEIPEAEALSHIRELQAAGRGYLHDLKQRADFRYSADLVTHDVVIALQALIADIEVLKLDLKQTFGIGQKWEDRFEVLLKLCEQHCRRLEKKLELDETEYTDESIIKLLHECVDLYRPEAKARWIEFRLDLEQLPAEGGKHQVLLIQMDRTEIRQALRNVIDNALKYSFSGTADRSRWIEVVGRFLSFKGVRGYTISVSNLGIGIEADELESVFKHGYQGRRRLNEARSGHGIGLAFVKQCIEKHRGTVTIRSQQQQRTGWLTTLDLWLPLCRSEAQDM